MGEMIKNTILLLLLVLSLGLLQAGCDLREGTIVYDGVEFPRADEVGAGKKSRRPARLRVAC